jgi:hypothetical protein
MNQMRRQRVRNQDAGAGQRDHGAVDRQAHPVDGGRVVLRPLGLRPLRLRHAANEREKEETNPRDAPHGDPR